MRIKMLMRCTSGTVEARESLAAASMRLASDSGGCLVVTDGGRLAGVLTPADARAAGPSTVPSLAVHEWPAFTSRLTVADAMRRDPVVVPPDATPGDAAHAMRTRGHRAAVVVDGSEVVGVVTTTSRRCHSRTPLDLALGIARRHRATLTLLHVMRGLSLRVAEGLPAGVDADVQRWRLAEVRAALIRRVPPEDRSMVRVDVRAGDVVEGVLNGAATAGAELIVMGGRPGASLVRETMRRAPCPVLAA